MKPHHVALPAFLVAAAISGCAQPEPSASAPASAPVIASSLAPLVAASGVVLHQPRAGLYSAGQPASGDWAGIAKLGVGTVINLRPEGEMAGRDEAAEVQAAGLRYIEIPVADADAITPGNARKLHEAIGSAKGAPVLVHCASANRAGGLLALAMVTEHGMDHKAALAFGRKAGMKSTEARVREVLEAQPANTKPGDR